MQLQEGYQVVWAGADEATAAANAAKLASALTNLGVGASVAGGATAVARASTTSLTTVATFLQKGGMGGIQVDLGATPPRLVCTPDVDGGSLLIAGKDGRKELRSGLNHQQMGYVIRAALATVGL